MLYIERTLRITQIGMVQVDVVHRLADSTDDVLRVITD